MRERPHREHPHTHPPSWRFTRWLRLCVSSRLARQAPHLSDHAIPKIGRETGSKAHALRSTRLEPSSPDGGPPRTIPSSGKKRTWSRSMHPALKEILLWQETQTHLQRVVVSCAKCLGTDTCWTRQGWKGCQRTEMTQHKEQCTLCGRRGWWGWGRGGQKDLTEEVTEWGLER